MSVLISLIRVYALFCFRVEYLSAAMLMNVSLPFHHVYAKLFKVARLSYLVIRNASQVYESLTQ